MSARSSSGSWSRAGGAPPDIIDLDKFMRGAVRPPRPEPLLRCDQLVVDAGGVGRKSQPASPPPAAPPPALSPASSSSGSRLPPHAKRFSHDSGLSDGSYARRKTRAARRGAGEARAPAAGAADNSSLRAFRAVCERALLDQQAQIARVAALCERLSERQPRAARPPRPPSPDTSDVSSSSRSTRDQRRKDKHRAEECKTYKIIMNKLDELNRLFAARARSPAAPPAPRASAPRRASPSSASVSVSDKLVATEPERRPLIEHNTLTCVVSQARGGAGSAGAGSSRLSGLRAVTNACALDIPPRDPPPRYNVATESVVQCDSRGGSSGGDPRCGFDLDDPVHLYSQAKRLQALPAQTRRARSVEPTERRPRLAPQPRASRGSLCALCRGYWRALTHYLAAQIFCYPESPCA